MPVHQEERSMWLRNGMGDKERPDVSVALRHFPEKTFPFRGKQADGLVRLVWVRYVNFEHGHSQCHRVSQIHAVGIAVEEDFDIPWEFSQVQCLR